jgi:hypothetical protein
MQSYQFILSNGLVQCVTPELAEKFMAAGAVESDPSAFTEQVLRPYMPENTAVETPVEPVAEVSAEEAPVTPSEVETVVQGDVAPTGEQPGGVDSTT